MFGQENMNGAKRIRDVRELPPRGVMLSDSMIFSSLKDDEFLKTMPEFEQARKEYLNISDALEGIKGCSPCARRRMMSGVASMFSKIASMLPADRAEVLKKHFNLLDNQRLYVRVADPDTKATCLKSI